MAMAERLHGPPAKGSEHEWFLVWFENLLYFGIFVKFVHPLVVFSCDHPVVLLLVVGPDRAPFLYENAFQSAARIYREEHLPLPLVWFRREFDTVVRPGPFSRSGGAAPSAIALSTAAPSAIALSTTAPFAIAPLAGHRSLGLVGTAGRSGEAPRSRRDPCGLARLEGKLLPMTH